MQALEEPLYERQPGESAVAYAAFRAYRDLGPGRSVNKAVSVLLDRWPDITTRDSRSEQSRDSYTSRAAHWSANHRWVERAAEWDATVDKIRLDAEISGMTTMADQYEARVTRIKELEFEIGSAAYEALKLATQVPPFDMTQESEDGKTVIHYHANPIFFKNLPGIMRESSRLVRLGLGLPTEGSKMPTPPQDTSADNDVQNWLNHLEKGGEAAPSAGLQDPEQPS